MKNRLMCSNGGLAETLPMGALHGVSRYVGETLAGKRPEAEELTLRLNAGPKDSTPLPLPCIGNPTDDWLASPSTDSIISNHGSRAERSGAAVIWPEDATR